MKALVVIGACLLANAAWAQQKVQSVVVTNPSLTVQAADAGRYTHVGQKPSRVVNLQVDRPTETFAYLVDPATGLIDIGSRIPFRVPDGFLFVLTDITGSSACPAGASIALIVYQFVAPSLRGRDVLQAECSDFGAYFERHYTTGLLFGAKSEIVFVGLSHVSHLVNIQGYLVPAD